MIREGTQQRRKVKRVALNVYCPAVFEVRGAKVSAVMQDLSQDGGGFRGIDPHADPGLQVGDHVVAKVWTQDKTGKCAGRVAWTRPVNGYPGWGVDFGRPLADPANPLRTLLEVVS